MPPVYINMSIRAPTLDSAEKDYQINLAAKHFNGGKDLVLRPALRSRLFQVDQSTEGLVADKLKVAWSVPGPSDAAILPRSLYGPGKAAAGLSSRRDLRVSAMRRSVFILANREFDFRFARINAICLIKRPGFS
jgi:hypothetical protein